MQVRRGPLYMILASAAFTSMVACVRIVRVDMSGLDVILWRAVVSGLLMGAFLRGRNLGLRFRRSLLLRVGLGFGAMTCFYTAAKETDLVTLSLISRLQPILVSILAPLVLGRSERPSSGVWIAALGGLTGSAILLAPDLESGNFASVWAVAATCFSAGAHVALRKVASEESGPAIVFWFQIGMLPLALLGLGVAEGGVATPPSSTWLLLLAVGVFATAGQLLLTRAYAVERAPVVAAASYAGVVWAFLLDLVVFGEMPTAWVWMGGGLVVVSSLYLAFGGQGMRTSGSPGEGPAPHSGFRP